MNVTMDFGALPPEINSARIYAGPGSAPMLTAAAAWNTLAAELRSTAASYQAAISGLTSEGWRGPASASMATAAAPYGVWMNTTAAQAEQTANQATAAAGAYEMALAASVPPPVIAANRAQLMSLIATNVLGQNTSAIAATEALYGEMWSQDAAAMYGYAGSSAAASRVPPFSPPQHTTNPGALATQAAAVTQATGTSTGTSAQTTLSQLTSALPGALQQLASPTSSMSSSSGLSGIQGLLTGSGSGNSQLTDFWSEWGPNANIWNTIFSSGFFMPGNYLGTFADMAGMGGAGAAGEALGEAATGGLGAGLTGPLGGLGGLGSGVSAGLGRAASIGPLSVPPSWTAATLPISPLGSALGGTPLTAPPAVATGMPGFAPTGMAGRGAAGAAIADTRFLVRPPMVPLWSAVG